MAFYKNFWSLAASTTYETHTVGSFDENTTTGGGTFEWIPSVDNFTITNIPGIRIKPVSSGVGYWQRVCNGPIQVSWFGTQNTTTASLTFAEVGISQATLNSRYGPVFATITDNYDTTAIRYALSYMGSFGVQNSLVFDPKIYWLTRSCALPIRYTNNIPSARGLFIIDGAGATIRNATTSTFDFFSRVPSSQTLSTQQYINNGFTFKNFSADGSGGIFAGSGKSFLFLGATTGSIIQNINLQNFDIGLRLENCLNATISTISTNNIKTNSILLKNGSWTGASLLNACSHNSEISHVNVYDTIIQNAGISVLCSNNCYIKQCTIDGISTPSYGIYWDSLNSSAVQTVRIEDTNLITASSICGVYLKCSNFGRHIVDGLYANSVHTVIGVEAYSGNPDVYVANIANWPVGSLLLDITTGTGNTWELFNTRFGAAFVDETAIVDPLNNLWDVIPTNSIIPDITKVRYTPPILL